jgi:hypothetical protein
VNIDMASTAEQYIQTFFKLFRREFFKGDEADIAVTGQDIGKGGP